MRILSIGSGLPDGNAKWKNTLERVEHLRSAGHEVHVVAYYDPNKHNRNDLLNGRDSIDCVKSNIYLTPISHMKYRINNNRGEYDLIYGNNYLPTFTSLSEKALGLPIVFHMDGDVYRESVMKQNSVPNNSIENNYNIGNKLKNYINWFMGIANTKLSDRIACVSRNMARYMIKCRGVQEKKISYIPNFVDINHYNPNISVNTIKQPSFPFSKNLSFGYVGGFQPWQGINKFLSVADNIKSSTANFIIVGRNGAASKNVARIGRVPRDQVREYYSICDVLVLPRPSHPVTEIAAPTKFAEYAAMGKPILSTKVGDAGNLIQKYNCGVVVDDFSHKSLREGIRQFVCLSDSTLEMMGENARELAIQEFSLEYNGRRLEKFVKKSIDK